MTTCKVAVSREIIKEYTEICKRLNWKLNYSELDEMFTIVMPDKDVSLAQILFRDSLIDTTQWQANVHLYLRISNEFTEVSIEDLLSITKHLNATNGIPVITLDTSKSNNQNLYFSRQVFER